MSDVVARLQEQVRIRREDLISKRAIAENSIAEVAENIKRLDPKLIEHIPIVHGEISARALLPSMYVEPFNREKYIAELEVLKGHFSEFNRIQEELINRAVVVLNE